MEKLELTAQIPDDTSSIEFRVFIAPAGDKTVSQIIDVPGLIQNIRESALESSAPAVARAV